MNTSLRRDRLLNLLHRGPTTVPEVAQALGVSERTIFRDIGVLRDAGHDIRATPGRGGGVCVTRDSRPRPVHFEVDEIIGLALSVAILKATPHMPFAASAEAALDRARRALSAERRRTLEELLRRVLVGGPASEGVVSTLGEIDDAVLPAFERCLTGSRSMSFEYVDRLGSVSSRRIECVALTLHMPAWYIVAWDLDKDASRVFRLDRISDPRPGDVLEVRHTLEQIQAQSSPADEEEAARRGWVRNPIG